MSGRHRPTCREPRTITIELVDAGTDRMIWSESYDRDLTDIFAYQSEVAEPLPAS